jgi:hypothetical protein
MASMVVTAFMKHGQSISLRRVPDAVMFIVHNGSVHAYFGDKCLVSIHQFGPRYSSTEYACDKYRFD